MSPDAGRVNASTARRLRLAGIVGVAIVVVAVAVGVFSRSANANRVREWTDEQALPIVAVVAPSSGGSVGVLDLPGRLEATSRAPLYARVSGYLKKWNVDIGARVKAGQLLAEIEAPDVEQQFLQAEADLATAEANASLAKSTAERWKSMRETDSVSRQDADEKPATLLPNKRSSMPSGRTWSGCARCEDSRASWRRSTAW
jgi:multidrug efflux pump subunit AcrA (membrane-fusion protein)